MQSFFLRISKKYSSMYRMKKIFTLTGNLLAETTARFAMPSLGETARALEIVKFQVGGKGVNVAKSAKMLGAESTAAIFTAGEIGTRCENSLRPILDTIVVRIAGQTREGLVCIDNKSGVETTFLGADVEIKRSDFEEMIKLLSAKIGNGDIFALCGSFPNWQSDYADIIIDMCASNNAKICIDTYGAPLNDFINKKVDLIKINRKEFANALHLKDFDNDNHFFERLESFSNNAKIFAVSDGSTKTLFLSGGKIFSITPTKVKEISATGCGDIMLASLIVNLYLRELPLRQSAEISTKIASAAAQQRDITAIDIK